MNIEYFILKLKKEENAGLGRIFRELRKSKELLALGDIIIYKKIINTLSLNGYRPTDRSITRHFKNIDPEDYDMSEKREIIEDLKHVCEN